jgi:hypothetical protein
MERPRGLEPPPTAWQAVVLPLYYGRIPERIYSTRSRPPQVCGLRAFPLGRRCVREGSALAELADARALDHR